MVWGLGVGGLEFRVRVGGLGSRVQCLGVGVYCAWYRDVHTSGRG
jgi:hypothetical protein